jgi:threonylcarbamoyladenosine tRNA methylthiotransferase MtaB
VRVALATIGCRLNQFETDAMEHLLREAGHEVVERVEGADVYVVNSCTVTHEADADTRQLVRRATRNKPDVRVIVTGCYAVAAPKEVAELPGVWAVLGNAEKADLPLHLEARGAAGSPDVLVGALSKRASLTGLPAATDPRRSRVLLKVQDGCNRSCAFCVVPRVRGVSRSLPLEQAVRRLEEIVAAGAPEIVLTGVDLGAYGRDLRPKRSLQDLVLALVDRIGGARLRLSSLDAHDVSDDLVELLRARTDRICRHLHLPLQSGDPEVLRRMQRGQDVEAFATLVRRLCREIPGIALGTDVIVGFPGETEAAFERTLGLIEGLPLAYAHVFRYSPRAGTSAATMTEQVAESTKSMRARRLREVVSRKRRVFRETSVGRDLPAVVLHTRDQGKLVGVTDNYVRLRFHGDDGLCGRWVRLRIDSPEDDATLVP